MSELLNVVNDYKASLRIKLLVTTQVETRRVIHQTLLRLDNFAEAVQTNNLIFVKTNVFLVGCHLQVCGEAGSFSILADAVADFETSLLASKQFG